MFVLQPVLSVLHLLQDFAQFIYAISYHVGKALILLLVELLSWLRDFLAILALIGEELLMFISELDASIDAVLRYIHSSTNSGFNCLLEGICVFCKQLANGFNSTRLQSKLLATKAGASALHVAGLLRGALLLITDCSWWAITIVPRTLLYLVVSIANGVVFAVNIAIQLALNTLCVLLDDIFRLTIGAVLLFLLFKHRRRLGNYAVRFLVQSKRVLWRHWQRAQTRWGRRVVSNNGVSLPMVSRTPLPRCRRAISTDSDKSPETLKCVVCRDRRKTVLLLPCKHLCLCDECADYMIYTANNYQCPLCRTLVQQSMTVYT